MLGRVFNGLLEWSSSMERVFLQCWKGPSSFFLSYSINFFFFFFFFLGCGLRLEDKDKMEYHRRCHPTGEKKEKAPFLCPECRTPAPSWRLMATHLWREHKIDIGLHKCRLCDFRSYRLGKKKSLQQKKKFGKKKSLKVSDFQTKKIEARQ